MNEKTKVKYNFEQCLENNRMAMSVVNARRFAEAVRKAIQEIDQAAGCYKLTNEPYYLETKTFLEEKLARLEAPMQNNENTNNKNIECENKDRSIEYGL